MRSAQLRQIHDPDGIMRAMSVGEIVLSQFVLAPDHQARPDCRHRVDRNTGHVGSNPATAQTFPLRPITIVMPLAAGGPTTPWRASWPSGMRVPLGQPRLSKREWHGRQHRRRPVWSRSHDALFQATLRPRSAGHRASSLLIKLPLPPPSGWPVRSYWTGRHPFATGRDLRIATHRAHSSVGRAADS